MAAFLLGGLYLGARVISPSYLKADPSKQQDNSASRIKGSSSGGAMATDKESPVWIEGVKPADIPKWQTDGEVRKRKRPKSVTVVSPNGNSIKHNPNTTPAPPVTAPAETTAPAENNAPVPAPTSDL